MPSGEGACGADGHEGALGAGVGKADAVHGWDAFAEDGRQPGLQLGGGAEGGAAGCLLLKGADHVGVGVAQDEACGVDHEVEIGVAVHIVKIVATAMVGDDGVGVEVGGAAGTSAGEKSLSLVVERPGLGSPKLESFNLSLMGA